MFRFVPPTLAALVFVSAVACDDAQAKPARPGATPMTTTSTGITVNGKALDAAFLARLGVSPGQVRPGNYWYDGRSGLAGLVGQGAVAIIAPNLPFAPLDPNCSNGTSGYFLNGRHLTLAEAQYVGRITGYIPPGRYFVDNQGNAGPEGGPVMINLVQASRWQGSGGVYSKGTFTTTEVDSTGVAVRDNSTGGTLLWPF